MASIGRGYGDAPGCGQIHTIVNLKHHGQLLPGVGGVLAARAVAGSDARYRFGLARSTFHEVFEDAAGRNCA